jgi:hypothetical protein
VVAPEANVLNGGDGKHHSGEEEGGNRLLIYTISHASGLGFELR